MILHKEYRYDADICGPRPRAGIAFLCLVYCDLQFTRQITIFAL